jgi:GNAT superfamily N-acetyltransferase
MNVRPAKKDEKPAVWNVLDGGLLELEAQTLDAALDDDRVLVAVGSSREVILGALVVVESEILAVAVRKRRQGQGIGTGLVEAALDRYGPLNAAFDERVRHFWETFDCRIEDLTEDDRYRVWLEAR